MCAAHNALTLAPTVPLCAKQGLLHHLDKNDQNEIAAKVNVLGNDDNASPGDTMRLTLRALEMPLWKEIENQSGYYKYSHSVVRSLLRIKKQ